MGLIGKTSEIAQICFSITIKMKITIMTIDLWREIWKRRKDRKRRMKMGMKNQMLIIYWVVKNNC